MNLEKRQIIKKKISIAISLYHISILPMAKKQAVRNNSDNDANDTLDINNNTTETPLTINKNEGGKRKSILYTLTKLI
jgi:hypothetical protein